MQQNYAITTILTAAASGNLTTLENVKADLQITGGAEDAYLKRAIAKASAAIVQFCNRTFALQTYQDMIRPQRDPRPYFLPNGQQPMYVRRTPLAAVTSVTENDVALVAGTDFEVDYDNSFIYRLNEFGNPKQWPAYKIVIVYQAGWVLSGNAGTPVLPADVEDACIRLIKNMRIARTRDSSLKSDEVAGVGRQEYWVSTGADGGNMPPDITDILNNYRIDAFA